MPDWMVDAPCASRRTIDAKRKCLASQRNGSTAQSWQGSSLRVHSSRMAATRATLPRAVGTRAGALPALATAAQAPSEGAVSSPPSTAQCSFHTSASRYVCNASAVRPSTLPRASVALGSRSVYFVGDSLSTQHFHAFACELEMDLNVPVDALHDLTAAGLDATCATSRALDVPPSPSRLCSIRAGENLHKISTATACRTLAGVGGTLRAGDVVVANEGLWRRAYDENSTDRELERVDEFSQRGSCVNLLRNLGVRLLWRETSAQHFDRTPTGQYKAGCKVTRCGGCGPVDDANALRTLNDAVSMRMRTMGVGVLPFFEPTLPLWTEHVARLSGFVRHEHILDCTHWCEPNTVYAALTPALLQTHTASRR